MDIYQRSSSSFSDKIGQYFGFFNSNSETKQDDDATTNNIDNIDYIIELPLIDNPRKRQSRFLLAMDYTLAPRHNLCSMDSALEHIMHYYDMSKAELVFVEMWQSVCLLIEFENKSQCAIAYNQLFQFFKTIFYIKDLDKLQQVWICAHCKHQNAMQQSHKRSADKNKIYFCQKCQKINHSSFKTIKYSYRKRKLSAKSQNISSLSPTSSIAAHYNLHNRNSNDNVDEDQKSDTPNGRNMFIGHAHGALKFNLPNAKPMVASKSLSHIASIDRNDNVALHNRNRSTPQMVGLHEKRQSVDSQMSVPSTSASTVSSIDDKLDLVISILQNIEQESVIPLDIETMSKQQMQMKQRAIRKKICKMKEYLQNIEPNIDELFAANEESENDDVVIVNDATDNGKSYKNVLTSRNLSLLEETKAGESLIGIASGKIKFK